MRIGLRVEVCIHVMGGVFGSLVCKHCGVPHSYYETHEGATIRVTNSRLGEEVSK